LIVFTPIIAKNDARLRDEAMDWSIRNWRHISLTRLRNIVAEQEGEEFEDEFKEEWGIFAATVNARAGVRWPGATTERRSYKVTGRSSLRPLSEPSLVALRMRATFGLSARTEILRHFLLHSQGRISTAALAELTSYQKRNVAEACDSLVLGGVLTERPVRNRFYYSLADPASLQDFIGAIPEIAPDWNALFRVVKAILRVADLEHHVSHDVLVIEVHQAAREIEDDLDALGLTAPRIVRGPAMIPIWDEWGNDLMSDLASGTWPDESEDSSITVMETRKTRRQVASTT
jgi:hypothetical protein